MSAVDDKYNREGLERCPFCGDYPVMQKWHGGKPSKRMISCVNLHCYVSPQVTGETPKKAAHHWNFRT